MAEKRVMFVMAHTPEQDIRISKEARTLKQAGYVTTLLYWDREGKTSKLRNTADYDEGLCLTFKAPIGSIMLLAFFPVWWSFVFFNLMMNKWDIVHPLNFHAIIPSLIAGKLKRKPVIYEILDIYEWMLPRMARTICMAVDKLFMRFADSIIVADEAQIEGIGGIPNQNIVPIYDSPPDTLSKEDRGYLGSQIKGGFTLFYAGVLYKNRRLNLNKVVEAIKEIEGVKLVIAGYGDQVEEIKEWSHHVPEKVEFIGKISYEESINWALKADLLFVLRDPIIPIHRYTCGSTLFNAMICGRPILSNRGTSTTRKVFEENCGIVVDSDNIEEIRNAIIKLRDNPELCKKLGTNARNAYEQRYSWEIMEGCLLALYRELTDEIGQRKKKEQNNGELSRQ